MSIEPELNPDVNVEPTVVPEPGTSPAAVNVPTPAIQTVETAPPPTSGQPIAARYGRYYRNTRYIMTAVTIVMGFWFLYDGFVRYPAENAKIDELSQQRDAAQARSDDAELSRIGTELKAHSYHSKTDLLIQRLLAFGLPPLGLLLLIWALYNSRGEYRLADDILYVPGHPPVPLAAVRELDETLWDRKGIALLKYTLASGESGRVKLDDFVYDRVPTDRIYEQIRASMQTPADAEVVAAPAADA
jgi:hypothetical protein